MAYEGVAIALVGVAALFFWLYHTFKNREEEESWVVALNENLANLFFGLGIVTIDIILYSTWIFVANSDVAEPLYHLEPFLKIFSLMVIIITIAVAGVILLKTLLVFLQQFFRWGIEKVGLMK